jgi:membrane protease YdiL (CAAX protease family)
VARYPSTAFLVMAFTFGWTALVPLLLSERGVGVLPIELPVTVFQALASVLGLVLPAFLVTAATEGKAGIRDLLQRSLRWRVGIHWYLIAVLGTFVGVLLAAIPFLGVAPLEALSDNWALLITVLLPGVLVPFLHTNLPEEIGWMGFLQSRLQDRHSPILASVMVAPVFALIHLPAYFVSGWISDEGAQLAELPGVMLIVGISALFSISLRLLLVWMYNGTRRSILIVALFHSAFNMSTGQAITPVFVPGASATVQNLVPWAVAAVIALVVIALTRGGLAYRSGPAPRPVQVQEERRNSEPQAHA